MPQDSFIPIAKSSGLIVDIGYHVLERCCQQIGIWMSAGLPAMRITVNASPLQFSQADFVSRVLGIIASAGIDPAWLDIEITESGLMVTWGLRMQRKLWTRGDKELQFLGTSLLIFNNFPRLIVFGMRIVSRTPTDQTGRYSGSVLCLGQEAWSGCLQGIPRIHLSG
jgi:hypothetical protein